MTDLATDRLSGPDARPDGDGSARSVGQAATYRWFEQRRVLVAGEILVSVVAALGFTLLCRHISVNPLNRIGQVSGLAKIQQYAAMIGLPILAVLVYTAYRGGLRRHGIVQRLVCAALAGLATGVVAGGVVVALRGTPWPLGGQEGDPSVLVDMATSMMHGKGISGVYPPLFPAAMALWSELHYGGVGGAGFALHDLQIVCSALVGPMSYLAWRLMLRPFWALAIAVPSALVFLDPIRPYSHVTMIVLLPLLAACLRELRRAEELSTRSLWLRGLGFGAVFGILFLWYSGWYLWAAPGVFLLSLFLFPWRAGRRATRRALLFLAVVLATAGAIGSPLLYNIVRQGADTPDRYAYIATYVDPAYVLGWMSDRNGTSTYHNWPQAGELVGQTGFAVMLIAAVGIGVGLGLRNLMVRLAAAVLAGAWLMRFWFASHMAHSQMIQLYPRTTWIIMYCLLILAVVGLMTSLERGVGWLGRLFRSSGRAPSAGPVIPHRVVKQLTAGLICALALFATMGASWSVDRYMPQPESTNSMGLDAWRAHTIKKKDGTCPKYSPVAKCADIITKDWKPNPDTRFIWCANVTTEDWPTVCGRQAPWVTGEKK
ncbi:hypothetical protein [Streptomyces sp. CBMA123]|uniref:hypothetical protein n=1 Tax=Streptomyces sp. CBMA123 TaxID=1896313 RepID=UPI001661D3FA|nr:hypothetical protein [Streptomyces sp. CBMA123]MBD0692856.1 hypothetical protein [Streptomyces sp. CBMA123]